MLRALKISTELAGVDMQDSKKIKAQLIEELVELRARLKILSDNENNPDQDTQPRSERNELKTSIQLIGDFGLVEAKITDLSANGIGFELEEDIPFDMEFEIEGELLQHRAHMVWMQHLDNGRSRFGFQFITAPVSSLLWLYKELDSESS